METSLARTGAAGLCGGAVHAPPHDSAGRDSPSHHLALQPEEELQSHSEGLSVVLGCQRDATFPSILTTSETTGLSTLLHNKDFM